MILDARFFELIFFAVIAGVLINRLLSILGEIEDGVPGRGTKPSFFGDSAKDAVVIDVTDSAKFIPGDKQRWLKISEMLGGFDHAHFIECAKSACTMIIKASIAKDEVTIKQLVDKRYVEILSQLSFNEVQDESLKAEIIDMNHFGHNILIKVEFVAKKFNPI